jgi:hypothetical protein
MPHQPTDSRPTGSHKHVPRIKAMCDGMWGHDDTLKSRRWTGPGKPGDYHQPFTSLGLVPSVTNVKVGDMVVRKWCSTHDSFLANAVNAGA